MTSNITLRRLNAGCGRNVLPGWTNLDSREYPGIDVVADLDRCAEIRLPLEDNSFDEILLSHVIEHIRNPLPMMEELHRIARPGAKAVIRVPYGSSDDAWEDQTHVRPYFVSSFNCFSQPYYWRADYGYRGDWQSSQIVLVMDGSRYGSLEWNALVEKVDTCRNTVTEMVSTLEAVKPIREPLRELQHAPTLRIEFTDLPS